MLQWRSLLDGTEPSSVPASLHCIRVRGKSSPGGTVSENLYQQIKFHYSHRQWEKCVRDKAATEQWTLRKPCSQSNTYHHCWWCAAAVSGSFGSAAPGPTTENKTDNRSEISVLPRPALAFPPFLYRETALSDNRCPQHNTNTALREKSGGGDHLVLCPVNVQVASKARRDCQRSVHVVLWAERQISRAKLKWCQSRLDMDACNTWFQLKTRPSAV